MNAHKWQTFAYMSSLQVSKCSVRCLKQKYCNKKTKIHFTLCILAIKYGHVVTRSCKSRKGQSLLLFLHCNNKVTICACKLIKFSEVKM